MEIEKKESLIVFTPSGHRDYFENDITLLEAARALGVDLDSVCGGRGICGRCQIEPTFGDFAKHTITSSESNISARGDVETQYKGRKKLEKNRRLACSARILGDLVVDVPPDSQIHKQVVRKDIDLSDLHLDPVISLHFLEVENKNSVPSSSELINALEKQWKLSDLANEIVEDQLPTSDGTFTAIVRDKKTVVGIWSGFRDQVFGIAIDVGSTTIAGHLCDLLSGEVLSSAGIMNPQIRFGED